MMSRRGSGRVKHLDIKALWCQAAIEKKRFRHRHQDTECKRESCIAYGCWEWTQHGLCWITVESNEDGTTKGDSKVVSQRHGRMSAEDLRDQGRRNGSLHIRDAGKQPASRQNG